LLRQIALNQGRCMVSATEEVAAVTRRHRVSAQLESELAVQGVAQAIVFLEPAGGGLAAIAGPLPAALQEIQSYFVKDKRSVAAALLSSQASLAAGFSEQRRSGGGATQAPRSYSDMPVMRIYPALRAVLGAMPLRHK
jgi:hypothetical protein